VPRTSTRAEPAFGELVSQYLTMREEHTGVLLLFRVGSFYEVLFEDAELVVRGLGLKLSDRPSGGSAPAVPQCGFAHHALDSFLSRLLMRGYRVAVVEEEEDAESSGVRHRAVVRTLTPGTVTDPALLADDRATYLAAIASDNDRFALAWTDVAAGEFKAGEFDTESAAAELQRLAPAELLVPADTLLPQTLLAFGTITRVGSMTGAKEVLRAAFPDGALADLSLAEVAAGLVVRYLAETAVRGQLPPLDAPAPTAATDALQMDAVTRRHLEIVETERTHDRKGSLLDTVDRCATPMGRRMLRSWLLRPLRDIGKICVRQAIIGELVANQQLLQAVTQMLEQTPDLERLAGRVAARTASTDDLHALAGLPALLTQAQTDVSNARTSFVRALGRQRPTLSAFDTEAARVLADPETTHAIRHGVSPALDQALERIEDAEAWQGRYLDRLRQHSALDRVKIERNSTQGLFIEVPANTPVPADWTRRGGLQKVERYTTSELEQHAVSLADAEAVVASETKALLAQLRDMAALHAATDRSLVILDEIGRGTSTHDGMAIAWAVIEHLSSGPVRPRAIVSTHYHELAILGERFGQITRLQATALESPRGLTFEHRIELGAADRSFGIEVARLAGMPDDIVRRARQIAAAIEPVARGFIARLEPPPSADRPSWGASSCSCMCVRAGCVCSGCLPSPSVRCGTPPVLMVIGVLLPRGPVARVLPKVPRRCCTGVQTGRPAGTDSSAHALR